MMIQFGLASREITRVAFVRLLGIHRHEQEILLVGPAGV